METFGDFVRDVWGRGKVLILVSAALLLGGVWMYSKYRTAQDDAEEARRRIEAAMKYGPTQPEPSAR